jgi:hypothetical protein
MDEPRSKLDDDFDEIGHFGPYQFVILILVSLTAVQLAILDYSFVFVGATPDYRCEAIDQPRAERSQKSPVRSKGAEFRG